MHLSSTVNAQLAEAIKELRAGESKVQCTFDSATYSVPTIVHACVITVAVLENQENKIDFIDASCKSKGIFIL